MGKPHIIIAGLAYGDEGKGSVTDYFCSTGYRTVVRYNGGPNAGHNVVLPSGRHHTFSQFGSGTFHPGVHTHLSRYMLVDPLALAAEYDHLKALHISDALDRLSIDGDALLVTPWHREANQIRETQRGAARHGSCGVGLGEARSYAIKFPDVAPKIRDCLQPALLETKIAKLVTYLESDLGQKIYSGHGVKDVIQTYWEFAHAVEIITNASYLPDLLSEGPAVFEGAQGVLLDEKYGFAPYNTWTDTTFANAEILLKEAGQRGYRLGVIRAYMTRHGAGPFVTEDSSLKIPEAHNGLDSWQGSFRLGHFDAVALKYALRVTGGVHGIAVTHLDAVKDSDIKVCTAYDTPEERTDTLTEPNTELLWDTSPVYDKQPPWFPWSRDIAGIPVVLRSTGPGSDHKERWASPYLT